MQVGQNGLAHVLLSPGTAHLTLEKAKITVACTTAYPFADHLQYTVTASRPFDFYVRVPSWAGSASTVQINKNRPSPLSQDEESGLHKLNIGKGTTRIMFTVDSSTISAAPREADTVAIYKGALLYALEIASTNTSTYPPKYPNGTVQHAEGYAPAQSRDYEYHNSTAWNWAIDPSTLKYRGPAAHTASMQLGNPIFSPDAPPGHIEVKGCQIDWPLLNNSVPDYPPTGDARKCLGKAKTLKLVPYAAAKTHMSDLPIIDL